MSSDPQTDLSTALQKATTKGYLNDTHIEDLKSQFEDLSIPTPENPDFTPTSWLHFIQECSGAECLALRKNYSSKTNEYKILTAISIHHRNTTDGVIDAFSIRKETIDESLIYNVEKFIVHTLRRYPLATLLSGWISKIHLCDSTRHNSLRGDPESQSIGYYHPTEHWISICKETGRPDIGWWGVTDEGVSSRYERSTTIHELGHALHYMFGLQTTDPLVDNSDVELSESNISIRESVNLTPTRANFILSCIKGYGLLMSGEYSCLDWSKNSRTNVEEFVAEGFNVYITSPRYLATEQYKLYSLFSSFDEYYC